MQQTKISSTVSFLNRVTITAHSSDVQSHFFSSNHFRSATNGVFVVLHGEQGRGDASLWMLMRSEALCLFHLVCLVKRCQSEWRGGTDMGRGVVREASRVESGLANRKWVTLSRTSPWHHYSVHSVHNPTTLPWEVPIIQLRQMKRAHRAAIAF